MAILLILLLVAETPTAFFNWASTADHTEVSAANATSYARCFFDMKIANERFDIAARCETYNFTSGGCQTWYSNYVHQSLGDTSAFQNMIVTFLLLIFNCFTRIIKLVDRLSKWATYSLRSPLSRWWRRKVLLADSIFLRSTGPWTPRCIRIWKWFVVNQGLALLLFMRLYADLYTSTLSEVSIHPSPTVVTTTYSMFHVTRYTGYLYPRFGPLYAFFRLGPL